MADHTVLVWQMPGGFSGEDQHRLAHHRLGLILRQRMDSAAPRVAHETGPVDDVVARCTSPARRPSALVLPTFRDHLWRSLEAVERLATCCPDLPILLSGWGSDPDYVEAVLQGRPIAHPRVALARGEAEEALVDGAEMVLRSGTHPVDALEAAGLAIPAPTGGWRSRGAFRTVKDLGQLPSPYLDGTLRPKDFGGCVLVEVARGCLYRCHFCLSCNYPEQRPRPFPTSRILEEIAFAADHHAESVGLLCSALNYDVDLIEAVAGALEAIPPKSRPVVESTVNPALLDERRLRAVMRLPWRRMIVGLQSTNADALAVMHRHVDLAAFGSSIEQIARVHTPVVELILGLPGDTLDGFLATMRFVLDLPVDVEVYPLRLDPGSVFMRDREALGIEADFSNQGRVEQTATFGREGLERAKRTLLELGRRPWRYRARRLGFDFALVHDTGEGRRDRAVRGQPWTR